MPFIFLTAHSQPYLIDELLTYNLAGYLSKPVNKPDLYAVMRLAFAKQKVNSFLIQIMIGKKSHRLDFSKVLYVEVEHIYSHIYLEAGNDLLRISLSNLVDQSQGQCVE
ncbi:hypothetical protein GO491_07740 [Flavobacteriaceae bacterium Ap0902]|nr:hypothetical protein [Flavobacteriaceae bacterium Ap0902]